jgi:hypothetical protein
MEMMNCSRKRRGFVGSTALVGILLGSVISNPGLARAQNGAGSAGTSGATAETQMLVQHVRTNRALLEGLERRRAALDTNSPANREAIAFLDSEIKLLWDRIGKDMDSLGQGS